SRRRHTRFSRDWSSDVCSSDLTKLPKFDEIVGFSRIPALLIIRIRHETHFPTLSYPSQAYSRLSHSHEDPWWSCRHQRAPLQGTQAPGSLIGPLLNVTPDSGGGASMRASFPPSARLHRPSEFASALDRKSTRLNS